MIPVRCFTCGALIGDKYQRFLEMIREGIPPGEALDKLGIKRYCCRRMFLSHVEVIDLFLKSKRSP